MIGGRDDTKSTSQRRQCWECARRRLVCDNTRPSCTKCTKSGVECPGYGKSKPLKWLEPGQVLSQRGRRRTPENEKQHKEAETKSSSTLSDSGKQVEDPIKPFDPSLVSLARVNNAYDAEVELIPRVNLIEETAEIVHSIHYYNQRVYPEYHAMSDMINNSFIMPIPIRVLHYFPAAMNHTLAYFTYAHQIHRREVASDRSSQMRVWTRVYHHRGLAIQELKSLVAREATGVPSDTAILSINQLLVTEILVLQSGSQLWRNHAAWLIKLIQFRGGYLKLFRSSPIFPPSLALFVGVLVFANATSPSNDQLSLTSPTMFVAQIKETYDMIFPYIICPEPLFMDIVTISNLRGQVASESLEDTTRHAGDEVLSRIIDFSPAQWALERPKYRKQWELVATMYQCSCVLYCIFSLQDHFILPCSPEMQSTRQAYGDILFSLMEEALGSFYVGKFMAWPLIVAGVEAAHRPKGVQRKVAAALEVFSVNTGISTPLVARTMLERFWASGKTGWDDCFDRPFALVV